LTYTIIDDIITEIAKEGCHMAISYLKLWKLLLDKGMKKTDLIKAADISTTTLAKLSKNQSVSMDVMGRICKALSCDIGDVLEMLPDENPD
jgi:DNA-binding Xre family transcriptional regulator